jgi:hypothetical protein
MLTTSEALEPIKQMIEGASPSLTIGERAGHYAGLALVIEHFRLRIDEEFDRDPFAHAKLTRIVGVVGALLTPSARRWRR